MHFWSQIPFAIFTMLLSLYMQPRTVWYAHVAVLAMLIYVADLVPLPMDGHKFAFVIGAHHSGTSLLKALLQRHQDISGHGKGLSSRESWTEEGQHLQSLFPAAERYGGMHSYGFHAESYMTESHYLVSDDNRRKLYDQWAGLTPSFIRPMQSRCVLPKIPI